ncbi:MAG: hypothetical protein HYU64_12970 [Armatimonadetes bacterium]|nr:hypothetical protein [Armatimonadota bacterium]
MSGIGAGNIGGSHSRTRELYSAVTGFLAGYALEKHQETEVRSERVEALQLRKDELMRQKTQLKEKAGLRGHPDPFLCVMGAFMGGVAGAGTIGMVLAAIIPFPYAFGIGAAAGVSVGLMVGSGRRF